METIKKGVLVSLTSIIIASTFAQTKQYGNTAEDSVQCVTNYSLYTEFFKQKAYTDALEPWRKTVKYCPALSKSLYINGDIIYSELMKQTKDPKVKSAYEDSIIALYDLRIKYFGEEGVVLGRKGSDMVKFKEDDPKAAYAVLKKSYEIQGQEMEASSLVYYYKSAYLMFKKGLLEKAVVLELYPELSEVCKNQLRPGNEKYHKMYEGAQSNLDAFFSPIADCADLIALYTPKYEATPDDTKLLGRIATLLDKKSCTDNDLFFQVASKMHELNPSAESAYNLGLNQKEKNCGKAIDFFKQAHELASDDEMKIKSAKQAAVCYLKLGQYSSSRTYAQKALAINPNLGDMYMLIGSAYAASAGQCGDNKCSQKAAYWVAVDTFQKAKSVDPSVEADANEKISTYKKYYPGKEDCFFYNVTEGTSYTVGCWINQTTQVRFN